MVVDKGNIQLFYKRGTFVEEVRMNRDGLGLRFYVNIEPSYRGPFRVRADVESRTVRRVGVLEDYSVSDAPLNFRWNTPLERYGVRVTLNGDLAFAGEFSGERVTDAVLP